MVGAFSIALTAKRQDRHGELLASLLVRRSIWACPLTMPGRRASRRPDAAGFLSAGEGSGCCGLRFASVFRALAVLGTAFSVAGPASALGTAFGALRIPHAEEAAVRA